MTSFLSSNDRISVHFDNIHLKYSTYFEVHCHSMVSKYENFRCLFCDVITNKPYIGSTDNCTLFDALISLWVIGLSFD